MISDEFTAGYNAYIAGLVYCDNPYEWPYQMDIPSQEWMEWARGWCEGEWQFGYYD